MQDDELGLDEFDVRVRYLINRFFVEEGFAPVAQDVARLNECPTRHVAASMKRLEAADLLTFFPGTNRIWAAHPFSSVPSSYWIESGGKGWWGNCGFCALGIAAMQPAESVIYSRLGAQREAIEVHTSDQGISPGDLLLHIPLPIAHWHDCLPYTCSNVHYFDSEEHITRWAEEKYLPRGQAVTLENAWALAQAWYGNYLAPDWSPRSELETNVLLERCGLTDSFWQFPACNVGHQGDD